MNISLSVKNWDQTIWKNEKEEKNIQVKFLKLFVSQRHLSQLQKDWKLY